MNKKCIRCKATINKDVPEDVKYYVCPKCKMFVANIGYKNEKTNTETNQKT